MNSFRSRLLVASFVVASTVVALSGCGGTDAGTPLDSGTVTIGTLRGQPHFYRPFLYEDFAADGLSYEIVTLDTAPALNDALISGAVDFAITGVTTTISSIAQDRELKIIASAADGGSGFIGNDTVDTLDDLVGATVGYIQGSAQEVVMRLILADAGIDPADLDLMVVPVHDMANAFATGSVDAFFGVEIGASIALQNGGHELADVYDTPIGNVNIGLVTTQELLDSDPELVQSVVDTHGATIDYMITNQTEWLTELVNTFGGDQTVLESALDNFWLRADLPVDSQDQLDVLATKMFRLGLIEAAPTVGDLVDTTFTKTAPTA